LANCGEIYEGLERWSEAFEYYDRAIANFEQQRGQLTVAELKAALASDSNAQFMYFNAARTALKDREAALAAGDTQAATAAVERSLHYIEQGKARSLLDLMADGLMLGNASLTESQALRKWRRFHAYLATRRGLLAQERAQESPDPERIAVLNQEIVTAEADLRTVETELATADPRLYRAQQAQSTVLSLAEISAQLPLDTALLQYAFLGDDLLAWAITRDGCAQVYRTTFEVRWLEQAIRAFHRGCETRPELAHPQDGLDDVGKTLADWLLEPFGQTITAYKRLIVVPYGSAHSLPFHALPWQGQPLADTHVLSYLPSASAVRFLATPDLASPQPVLAIGDPAAMAWRKPGSQETKQANPLPCAAVEATYVASLFPGSQALIREQVTAADVSKAIPRYRRLHFATHGFLSEDVPLLSSILLANGEALSVYDLMGLRMEADLVVLSACRTAQGETTGGDDVLGLTRGLLAAGARAAVVTLWPVDDAATSLLMGEFYRQLQAGKAPSVALQQAQLYLRKLPADAIKHELEQLQINLQEAGAREVTVQTVVDQLAARHLRNQKATSGKADYSHPYYWAPFVLIGL
jgi:CHAT domain-containing protein